MTCATFQALNMLHMQNVQSKTGIYDLYMALEQVTDNSGLQRVRVRLLHIRHAIHSTNDVYRDATKRSSGCYKNGGTS